MSYSAAAPVIGIRELGALDLVHTLLRQGVTVRIRVSGDSMRPLLQSGELVEVAPLRKTNPRLGDILFIRSRWNAPIIHRLIWRRNQHGIPQLLTKGDACLNFDGFIPAGQVLGRIECIYSPSGTAAAISLRTPLMHLRAAFIVSRALLTHLGRKAISMSKKECCLLSSKR